MAGTRRRHAAAFKAKVALEAGGFDSRLKARPKAVLKWTPETGQLGMLN